MRNLRRARSWSALLVASALTVLALPAGVAHASCALSVSGSSPTAGFTAGGTVTTLAGCDFTGGTLSVSYGDTPGTVATPSSDTSVTVTSPVHASGQLTVTLTLTPTTGSASTATTSFTYVDPPTLSSVVPPSGPEKGGTPVVLTGTHLQPPVGTLGVAFAAVAATSVQATSDSRATAVSPAGTGAVHVTATVTLPGGEKATSGAQPYRYVPAPVVSSVSPGSGPAAGGTDVTVTGHGFQAGATVFLGPSDGAAAPVAGGSQFPGDVVASPVAVLSDTAILITTRAGAPGPTNVVVVNPDNQYGALTAGSPGHFSFFGGPVPTLTAVSPATGTSLGGTRLTLTGSGFTQNPAVTFRAATDSSPVSGTTPIISSDGASLTVTAPAHPAGAVDVRVTNADGQGATLAGAYTYAAAAAPTLTGASTSTAPSLGGTTVTVTGSGFAAGAAVSFGSTRALRVAVLSATSLSVTVPARPAGSAPLAVTNPDGQSAGTTLPFTVTASPAPTITSLSPTHGLAGTDLTLTGTGVATAASGGNAIADAVVTVGSAPCVPGDPTKADGCLRSVMSSAGLPLPIVRSSSQVEGLVPSTPGGAQTVTVTNPDGQSASSTFTNDAATGTLSLGSVSPATGTSLGGTTVTLSGANLLPGAIVTFGAISARASASTVASDGTSLTTVLPSGVYGLVDVSVTNPGGAVASLPFAFTSAAAPRPTITSLTPAAGPGGTAVTITGTGFANLQLGTGKALSAASVTIGGMPLSPPATGPVVISDTTINGRIPTSASTSPVDVAVLNPDGQGDIKIGGFSYPADTTAPTTTATATAGGAPYTFGTWSRTPVSVLLSTTDTGTGVKSITYSATGAQPVTATTVPGASTSATIGTDGTTSFSYGAVDQAGNAESTQTRTVKVDRTPPAVTVSATAGGVPYGPGTATNQDVSVLVSCTDAGSGVATLTSAAGSSTTTTSGTDPLTVVVSSTGTGQYVTGICTDAAGNTTSASFSGINIARTAPTIAVQATVAGGTPYTAGTWTNRTVTVTFTCTAINKDDQVTAVTPPIQVDGPVHGATASGTCTDAAGNSSTTTFGTSSAGIDIDLVLPVATASATTTNGSGQVVPYTSGTWTAHNVVVTFACTDPGTVTSGVAAVATPVTVTAAGTTSGVTGGCTDVAGNTANPPAFFGPILIDRTPPTCSVIISPNNLSPANGKLVAVTALVSVTDAQSGPAAITLLAVASNNPATASSDIVGFTIGAASTAGQLRATKGRIYTFTYRVADQAGNMTTCTAQAIVK